MSPDNLSTAAAVFELGVPVVLFLLYVRAPRFRAKLIVLLGAVTPAIVIYAWLAASFLFASASDGSAWAFHAAWLMTFLPYVVCLFFGALLAFLRSPAHLATRYLIGLTGGLAPGLVMCIM